MMPPMFKLLCLYFAVVMTVPAYAGTGVGNGGGAFACKAGPDIVSVHVLDLVASNLPVKILQGDSFQNILENIISTTYHDIRPEFRTAIRIIQTEVQEVIKLARFGYFYAALPFTYDTGTSHEFISNLGLRPFDLRICGLFEFSAYIQAAIFSADEKSLVIDLSTWEKMDETNKAALILHEAIYSILRKAGQESSSYFTRKLVSHLFSDIQLREYETLFYALNKF